MAKKKAEGIMSEPPKKKKQEELTRVSPGVYKDAKGNTVLQGGGNAPRGNQQQQGGGKKKDRKPQGFKSDVLAPIEEKPITQQFRGDAQLGEVALDQMPQIQESFEQPFDFGSLPTAPVSGDFNQWRQQQIDLAAQDFETRNAKAFAQQSNDFEQQMANRGIPVGSKLYNDQKAEMQRQQDDARQSALNSAMQQAGTNASQFFNVGTQAQQNALNLGMTQRYQPLTDYSALMGARSNLPGQAYQFSNQAELQANQKFAPFAPPAWQQAGFGSYQDYAGFEDARAREQAQYQQSLQPKKPSYGSQLGGQIAGSLIGGWAGAGFPNPF